MSTGESNGAGAVAEAMLLLVPQALAQSLANYLQTKPFQEVHAMITALVQCQMVPSGAPLGPPSTTA